MFNKFMNEAILQAKKARENTEVPVGCVIVRDNEIIAKSHNRVIEENNPLNHAEILAIGDALKKLDKTYLSDCTLYVTKEPCIMCLGAIINARVKNVYFGAYDTKYGASEHILNLMHLNKVNHYPEIYGGIMENECRKILEDFFRCDL